MRLAVSRVDRIFRLRPQHHPTMTREQHRHSLTDIAGHLRLLIGDHLLQDMSPMCQTMISRLDTYLLHLLLLLAMSHLQVLRRRLWPMSPVGTCLLRR